MHIYGYDTKKEWLMCTEDFIKKLGKVTDNELAEMYGVGTSLVFEIRTDLHKEPRRKHTKKRKCSKLPDTKQLLKEYAELGSLQEVADKYGVTRQAVSVNIKRHLGSI